MKKFFKIALASVCALSIISFAACAPDSNDPSGDDENTFNGKTTTEIYTAIMENLENNSRNFKSTISFDIKMDMASGGTSMSLTMEMNSISYLSGNNEYAKISTNGLSSLGASDVSSEVWYVDGVMYVVSGSQKIKQTISLEDYLEQSGIDIDEQKLPLYQLTDEVLAESYFDTTDGETTLIISVSGEESEELANQLLESTNLGFEMSISDITYVIHLDENGNFEYADVDYTADATIQGVAVKYTYDGVINITDIGTTTVNAPANADQFIDITQN